MLAAYNISYKYKDHWTCHQSRMVSQTYEQKKNILYIFNSPIYANFENDFNSIPRWFFFLQILFSNTHVEAKEDYMKM